MFTGHEASCGQQTPSKLSKAPFLLEPCTAMRNGFVLTGEMTECLSGFFVQVLVITDGGELVVQELQDVALRQVHAAHIDAHPSRNLHQLFTVYYAGGHTLVASNSLNAGTLQCDGEERSAQQLLTIYHAFDPASFHFTQVNLAIDRELASVGGWKSFFVLDYLQVAPKEYVVVVLKVHATTWKTTGAFRCPLRINHPILLSHFGGTDGTWWVCYHNGFALTKELVDTYTGDFFSFYEKETAPRHAIQDRPEQLLTEQNAVGPWFYTLALPALTLHLFLGAYEHLTE